MKAIHLKPKEKTNLIDAHVLINELYRENNHLIDCYSSCYCLDVDQQKEKIESRQIIKY